MKVAAKNVNHWMSVTTLMPLLGGFLTDGYLGRFSTVAIATAVYLLVSLMPSSVNSIHHPPPLLARHAMRRQSTAGSR
jgi:dipeptide/tripeptide permease